jgi:hypothetical protein
MFATTNTSRCLSKLAGLGVVTGALLLALPSTAVAQTCLQNEYNLVQKQKLNCTANDVRIAKVQNVRDPVTGAAITSCVAGSTFNFLADFEIVTTSSQARENIGLYISTSSQTQALTGSCVDNIISPPHPCGTGQTCGSDNYHETDSKPDNCGDTSSSDSSTTFGAGAEKVTLEIDNFLCEAPAGTNQVQLPNCTSWQIPGGTIQCIADPTTYAYPFNGPGGTPTAIPGSPSKCNCAVIPLGVTVQSPAVNVGKACNTGDQTTLPTFSLVNDQLTGSPNSCTTSPEGGTVTYTVEIANDRTNFGSVVVDQVCDTAYGEIFHANGVTASCNAGTQCAAPNNVTGTGCASSTTCSAATIALNGTYDCTFTVSQPEGITVTNTATGYVHGSSSGTSSGTSNSVSVTSGEAATTGTATKGVNSTTNACATVRYSADIKNTSATGTDETLSLTALADTAFGDLTTCAGSTNGCTSNGNANVLGTTCGVANGIGTLHGTTGTGALPATIGVGSTYSCLFDAQICGGLTNGCFTHTNSLNPTVAGEGEPNESVTVTNTPSSLNVKVCATTTVVP